MFHLTKDGFEAQVQDGVYVFESAGCNTCKDHIKQFQNFMKDFYIVPTKEDPGFFESIGIRITPTTRVYKSGKMLWNKEGVLFDTQLDEMRKYL
jgi:hypothetical protein